MVSAGHVGGGQDPFKTVPLVALSRRARAVEVCTQAPLSASPCPMEIPCLQLHLLLLAVSGVLWMGHVQGMERENPDYRLNADSGFVFMLRMCRLGTYTSVMGSYRMSPCCAA